MKNDKYVLIGAIVKPHGIKGEVKVFPIDTDVSRFSLLEYIYIGESKAEYKIETYKPNGKFAVLKLCSIDSIEEAEKIIKMEVYTTFENRPQLSENNYYVSDLEGMEVFDRTTGLKGIVTKIETYPVNDILICKFNEKIAKIPMIKHFINHIDEDNRIIEVSTIDGMIE